MSDNPDVLIVGGGVIGSACARELASEGARVRVVDRGDTTGAGWTAAAGMLAAQVEANAGHPLFELGLAGRERLASLAPALLDSTGIDIEYRPMGILQIADTDSDAERLRSKVAWQRQQGHLCDWLSTGEVRELYPWIGHNHGGLWAPRDGSINPMKLVEALRADAASRGVEFLTDDLTALLRSGKRVVGARGAARHEAGMVVLAAGAWTGRFANLPRPVSVEPVRGQMLLLPWPAKVPPAIVFGCGGYLMERSGDAICGSTMEHAGFNVETTESGTAQILEIAAGLCPKLAGAPVQRSWAGLRPGTPDGLPIIGREPNSEGLWYATGHGRNGILLSGITALILKQLMSGEPMMEEEVEALAPERFWSW